MCVKNLIKSLVFFVFLMILNSCDVMDTVLPVSNAYKLNASVNNIPIDECSFIAENDQIHPYFDMAISDDPDITALMVFLRNSKGETAGWKVLYTLEDDDAEAEIEEDKKVIQVKNLDDDLPSFPIPPDLPVGRYTMVSQVMCGKDILQKTEKLFYYLGNTSFSYNGINVYLPGVTDNSQIIPKGMVIMLEANLNFDSQIDPYIVWYNGVKKISEGKFSAGAGFILWEAPEQSGFYSISAEVFPIDGYSGLTGFQKEVSLLVSSKTTEMNLISESIPQLVNWYTFEGNLNDSKLTTTSAVTAKEIAARSLKPLADFKPQWVHSNGTYGLAAGYNNVYSLPKLSGNENWQTFFRFAPINDGGIFYVQFGSSSDDVFMTVSVESQNLILTLTSPQDTVSQTLELQEQRSFITAGISFSVLDDLLTAKINIIGNEQDELELEPVSLEVADIENNFQIFIGHKQEDDTPVDDLVKNDKPVVFTALWDEFAVYDAPPMETILADVKRTAEFAVFEQVLVSSN